MPLYPSGPQSTYFNQKSTFCRAHSSRSGAFGGSVCKKPPMKLSSPNLAPLLGGLWDHMYATVPSRAPIHLFQPKINFLSCTFLPQWRFWRFCMQKTTYETFEPKSCPAPGGALGPHVCHCTLQGPNPPISTKNQLFVVHIPPAVALLRVLCAKTPRRTSRAQILPRSWGGSGTTCMPLYPPGPQSTYFNQKSTFCRAHSSRRGAFASSVCKNSPTHFSSPNLAPLLGGLWDHMYATVPSRAPIHLFQPKINFLSCTFLPRWRFWRFCMQKTTYETFEPKSCPAPGGALGPHVCHCTLQGPNPPISTKNQLFVVHIPPAAALLAVLDR